MLEQRKIQTSIYIHGSTPLHNSIFTLLTPTQPQVYSNSYIYIYIYIYIQVVYVQTVLCGIVNFSRIASELQFYGHRLLSGGERNRSAFIIYTPDLRVESGYKKAQKTMNLMLSSLILSLNTVQAGNDSKNKSIQK